MTCLVSADSFQFQDFYDARGLNNLKNCAHDGLQKTVMSFSKGENKMAYNQYLFQNDFHVLKTVLK